MTIHLYTKSKADAFRLCEQVVHQLGYSIHAADPVLGIISGMKSAGQDADHLFFDLKLHVTRYAVSILIVSSLFAASSGTFMAETENEEQFMEVLHSMMSSEQVKLSLPLIGGIPSLSAA